MFRIGILSINPVRPAVLRTIFKTNNIVKRTFLTNLKSKITSPVALNNSNYWKKLFNNANARILPTNFQRYTQKRPATFRDLGRTTGYRSEPKYNNVQNNIIKPFIFATIFTVATYFLLPYLFEYTPMAYFKKNPSHLVWTILGLNAIVFGLWQIRYSNTTLYKTLENYFIMDRSALTRKSNLSLLLSSFSHQEPFHLLVNMGCLYSFSSTMISMLGITGFTSLYLISGVWASFFSLAYSQIFRHFGRSLGASGSIAGVFTAFATMFPTAGISFFFIPIPGGASVAAGLFALYNVAGCLMKWGSFDYAAHLGGMWVGLLWGLFLKWKIEREEQERRDRLKAFRRW